MFTLSEQQMVLVSSSIQREFRRRALVYLRECHSDLCAGLDDISLQQHVMSSIEFSLRFDVRSEANILAMVVIRLMPNFQRWCGPWAMHRLTQMEFDEKTRISNFENALLDHYQPMLISLESDLGA